MGQEREDHALLVPALNCSIQSTRELGGLERECVVEAGPNATDAAVTGQPDDAPLGGTSDELALMLGGGQPEDNVHQRPGRSRHRTMEEAFAAVDRLIDQPGTPTRPALHLGDSTLTLDPGEHQPSEPDCGHRRGVRQ